MKIITASMTNTQIADMLSLDPDTCYGTTITDENGIRVTDVVSINLETGEAVVLAGSSVIDKATPRNDDTFSVMLKKFTVFLYTKSGLTASHRLDFSF